MSDAFKPVRPLGDFLRMLIAPTIWFAHLSIIYLAEALICIGPPAARSTAMAWMVFLTTAAALTGLIILAAGILRPGSTVQPTPHQEHSRFFRTGSLLLALLSVLGVIWTILPAAFLPACALPSAPQG